MNMNDDQRIVNQLKEDLSKKSIEELIYLNFNPTGYVEESTKNLRDQNERLLNEVNSLNSDYQSCLSQYGDVKSFVDKYQSEVQEKENELRQLRQQKKAIDSSMTLESLKKELKKLILHRHRRRCFFFVLHLQQINNPGLRRGGCSRVNGQRIRPSSHQKPQKQ